MLHWRQGRFINVNAYISEAELRALYPMILALVHCNSIAKWNMLDSRVKISDFLCFVSH